MVSTPSTRLGFELMSTGSFVDTWGTEANNAVFQLVDQACAGVTAITLVDATTYILTTTVFATNEARSPILLIQGNPGVPGTVQIPTVQKFYIAANQTLVAQQVTITNGINSVVMQPGGVGIIYTDGVNIFYAPIITQSGQASPGTVFFSASDTTADFLNAKILIGPGLLATEAFPGGGDQSLTISAPALALIMNQQFI